MSAMYKRVVGVAIVLVAALSIFANAHAQGDVAAQVLAQINQARTENGLPALARNGKLDAAALAHAEDLRKHGVTLGHRGSDGSSMRQRIANAGYASSYVGENWAAYRTLDQIMTFWLNDPPHRENILKARFREIGIGVAVRANGGLIVITDFGGPENAPEMAAPASKPAAPKKARATPTRPKPTAVPKPTRTPTRKPTVKPTRANQVTQPVTPFATAQPTRIAQVTEKQNAPAKPLRARGRIAQAAVQGSAQVAAGAVAENGSSLRMILGALLALGGTLLLGVAFVGHRRASSFLM